MADVDPLADEGEGEEEEPVVQLTPEEKIEALKQALANGEMGPATFDLEFQQVWLKMKEDEAAASGLHDIDGVKLNRSKSSRGGIDVDS